LDAKCCETTTNARNQPISKTPVTIEYFGISPGQSVARYFPRTEEARGSNPLTSTIAYPRYGRVGGGQSRGYWPNPWDSCTPDPRLRPGGGWRRSRWPADNPQYRELRPPGLLHRVDMRSGCRPVTRSMIPPRWSRGGIATAVEYGRESDLTVGDG